jgi:hypothetical protein
MNYFEFNAHTIQPRLTLLRLLQLSDQVRDDIYRVTGLRWHDSNQGDAKPMSRDQVLHRRLEGFRIHCYADQDNPEQMAGASLALLEVGDVEQYHLLRDAPADLAEQVVRDSIDAQSVLPYVWDRV